MLYAPSSERLLDTKELETAVQEKVSVIELCLLAGIRHKQILLRYKKDARMDCGLSGTARHACCAVAQTV